jgi:hypothetical protein
MQIIIAVIGATFTYVITKFILDSILEQKKVIADIAYALTFDADIYSASKLNDELIKPVSNKIRELSARLLLTIRIIPGYDWLELFHIVRKSEDIKKASKLLMGIANSITPAAGEEINYQAKENCKDADEVEKILKIK